MTCYSYAIPHTKIVASYSFYYTYYSRSCAVKGAITIDMKRRDATVITHTNLRCVPLHVLLAAAEQTGAVDERIHHRVGHPEEKYPDKVSVVDMRSIHERVDDEHHLANASVNNDIISDKTTLGLSSKLNINAEH